MKIWFLPLLENKTQKFNVKFNKFHNFRLFQIKVQDYSWDDHGFSLVNRLYQDVGHLLDDKFRAAYNLTYFTMADKTNVDTSKFRRAIWNYIQCIYGIRHDDYDYGEVNQVGVRVRSQFDGEKKTFSLKIR